ncbi:943_t:CDS:1, partial [Gigaspora margarita]
QAKQCQFQKKSLQQSQRNIKIMNQPEETIERRLDTLVVIVKCIISL